MRVQHSSATLKTYRGLRRLYGWTGAAGRYLAALVCGLCLFYQFLARSFIGGPGRRPGPRRRRRPPDPNKPPIKKPPVGEPPPGGLPGGGNNMSLPDNEPLVFLDMRERDKQERERLEGRLETLKKAIDESPYRTDLKAERDRIQALLNANKVVDPLFKAVQKLLDAKDNVGDHVRGVLPSQQGQTP